MNYYERYCGDYQRDTAHLSLAEHGVYTILLDVCYSTEKPLPADYKPLFRICRAMDDDEQEAVKSVADQFFPVCEDGFRHNPRADEDIISARKRIDTARENGKTGGRPRKPKNPAKTQRVPKQEPSNNPVGIPPETQRVSGMEPTGNPVANPPATRGQSSPAPYSINSVTNVTGANAPDAKDFVFAHGLTLLTEAGTEEQKARKFLGKCCSMHGDLAVAQAVGDAIRNKSGDPIPYLQQILAGKSKPSGSRDPPGSTRNRTLEEDLTDTSWADRVVAQ